MLGKFNLLCGSIGPCDAWLSMEMTSCAVRRFKCFLTKAPKEKTTLQIKKKKASLAFYFFIQLLLFSQGSRNRHLPFTQTTLFYSTIVYHARTDTHESTSLNYSTLWLAAKCVHRMHWKASHMKRLQVTGNFSSGVWDLWHHIHTWKSVSNKPAQVSFQHPFSFAITLWLLFFSFPLFQQFPLLSLTQAQSHMTQENHSFGNSHPKDLFLIQHSP